MNESQGLLSSPSINEENHPLLRNEKDHLKKNTLSLSHALAMSITSIAPTVNIFFLSGLIAEFSGASAPFVIILAGFMCSLLGLTIREFAKHIPTSGSFFTFVSAGLGKEMGFLTVWMMVFGYGTLSVNCILQFSAWSSDAILRNTGHYFGWYYLGIILVIVAMLLAWGGINQSHIMPFEIKINKKGGPDGNYPLAFTPVGDDSHGFAGIVHALVFATLVFIGFENAAVLGEETKNPKRNVGIAVLSSIGLTTAYMAFGSYAMVIGQGVWQSWCWIDSKGWKSANLLFAVDSATDLFARKYIGRWFAVMIDLAGVSATFNVAIASFNMNTRILFSLGRERVLGLSFLGKVDSKRGTPIYAIFLFGTITLSAAIGLGLYAGSPHSTLGAWTAYAWASYLGTLPVISVYLVSNIALIRFYHKYHPEEVSVLKHRVLPVVTFLLLLFPLGGNFYAQNFRPYTYFVYFLLGWIILGVVLMFAVRKWFPEYLEKIGHAFDNKN